jgi:hypothetical protein
VVKVETNRTKVLAALITVSAAVLLLGAGAWLFLSSEREEIKTMRAELLGASRDKQEATDPLDAGYAALAAGEWETAREAFAGATATVEPRTPRAMWARANHAVALTLLGNNDQAASHAFAALA